VWDSPQNRQNLEFGPEICPFEANRLHDSYEILIIFFVCVYV